MIATAKGTGVPLYVVESDGDCETLLAFELPAITVAADQAAALAAALNRERIDKVHVVVQRDSQGRAFADDICGAMRAAGITSVSKIELNEIGAHTVGTMANLVARAPEWTAADKPIPREPVQLDEDGLPEIINLSEAMSDHSLLVDAGDWLDTPPEAADAVMSGVFDTGDKMPIIGSSKTRKTFFVLQLAIMIAAGRSCFLKWQIPKHRRVLFVQMEVKAAHFHARVYRMGKALGMEPAELDDRLAIANLRGVDFKAHEMIRLARRHEAEVVIVDPVYKLMDGDENLAKDVKPLLAAFDRITMETGAAVLYVHHDSKGDQSEKRTRDRGAGSGVLARDFDAAIYLTEHKLDGLLCVETLLRNYAPQDAFSIRWENDHFVVAHDVATVLRTKNNGGKSGAVGRPLADDAVLALVTTGDAQTSTVLIAAIRDLGGMTKDGAPACRDRLVTAGKLVWFKERRAQGPTWYGTPDQIEKKRRELENPSLKGTS